MKITNSQQFAALVAELEKNPSLAKGFHRGNLPVNFKEQWNSISNKLNASGPPIRTGDGWQKVWRDLKCKTKKKLVYNKAECRATGGGINKQMLLNPLEEAVSNLLQFEKHINPKGVVQGTAPVAEQNDNENVPPASSINMDELPLTPAELLSCAIPQSPVQQPVTPARRARKQSERQELLEKHNSMQERVFTEISTTLASIQNTMKDLSRYQRKQWDTQENKLKLMQRAHERGEELHATEMRLKDIKMQIKEKELEVLLIQCQR